MNKRFSTLLAAALVAGGLSANAQAPSIDGSKAKELVSNPARNYMLTTDDFTTNGALSNLNPVLATTEARGEIFVNAITATPTDVNKQLWTIEVKTVSGSNRFVLRNKATGLTLSFNPEYALKANDAGVVPAPDGAPNYANDNAASLKAADGDTEWTWVSAPNAKNQLDETVVLRNAFRSDSTMGILVISGYLYAYKYANDNVPNTTSGLPSGAEILKLQAVEPGSIPMTEADLNVLGETPDKYFTLSTNKSGLIGDVISGVKFQATDGTGAYTGYVTLKELGTKKYFL